LAKQCIEHPAGQVRPPGDEPLDSVSNPRRALLRAGADPQSECEQESVKLSLENLLTFPWIAQRVTEQRVRLSGMIFDIRSGVLTQLQPDGNFEAV